MKKQELEDLKSSFIDEYIGDYTRKDYHSTMVDDLNNLCDAFADYKYSLSNESKVRRILNRKVESLESEKKELVGDHKRTLQVLSDVINGKIDFGKQTVKERLEKYIEANKGYISNDNQETQEVWINQIKFNLPL